MGQNESPQGAFQLVGRGEVYAALYDNATGLLKTGERFLGNCKLFAFNVEPETAELFSSADAAGGRISQALLRVSTELEIQLTDYQRKNLALALLGDESAVTNTVGSVTDEAIPVGQVKKGEWFKLTRRNVSAVVVTGPAGSPVYVLNTDYKIDAVAGRIRVQEAGAIADGATILVDYAAGADTSKTIRGLTQGKIEAMFRFIPDPNTGPKYEAEIWKAQVRLDGALALISDEYSEYTLRAAVIADSVNHPTEPYYRLIERAA